MCWLTDFCSLNFLTSDKDEDDRESDGPELEQLRQDQDASMSAMDSSEQMSEDGDDDEDEDEEEGVLTSQQEEEYLALMIESK